MNQYSSNIRTITARNVCEAAIAPPANLALTALSFPAFGSIFDFNDASAYPNSLPIWKTQSNFILRKLGLFCNFGDGLVYASPTIDLAVSIGCGVYNRGAAPITGTVSLVRGTKVLAGAATAFLTDLATGDVVVVNGVYYQIESVTSDVLAALTDYARYDEAGASMYVMAYPINGLSTMTRNVRTLNWMYEQEKFLPVSAFTTTVLANPVFIPIAYVEIFGGTTLNFLTKTIDPSYAGSTAIFDVIAEVEMTSSGQPTS